MNDKHFLISNLKLFQNIMRGDIKIKKCLTHFELFIVVRVLKRCTFTTNVYEKKLW